MTYDKKALDYFHLMKCRNTHTHNLVFKFKQNLTTKELGRLVIYTDVITSTNNVIHGHFLRHGLVVIAARQTAGRGYTISNFFRILVYFNY